MEYLVSWGHHLIADFSACDIEKITDKKRVEDFSRELVKAIDMVPYGEPQVVNFGSGNKAGFTLVQLIETSNICAHFCNEDGAVYLDVFSCKPFEASVAIEVFQKYFNPKNIRMQKIKRQAPKLLSC